MDQVHIVDQERKQNEGDVGNRTRIAERRRAGPLVRGVGRRAGHKHERVSDE